MNGDLISRKALIEKMFPYGMPDGGNYGINARAVMKAVTETVAVEAEPVVRCAECMNYCPDTLSCRAASNCDGNWYPEDFCSYGAKMKDEVVDG